MYTYVCIWVEESSEAKPIHQGFYKKLSSVDIQYRPTYCTYASINLLRTL